VHATRDGKEVIFMSWQDFLARHQVGDVIEGVVTDQMPFGSFVESEGFTGLAPEQSWPAGTRVSVRILAIDPDRQRFSLAPAQLKGPAQGAVPGETDSPGAAP
jgi:ribosomal protein S1